jgi:alpha-beta hydrolase superfamily lysophospholipase
VHGLGEHIGRYEPLAEHLNAAGWNVAGYDLRGHGASGGARGAIADAECLLADLGCVIDALHSERPLPIVLLGHSMGGVVAARFVAEGLAPRPAPWWRAVHGLVLSSPALAAQLSAGQRALLATLNPLAPNLPVANGIQPSWLSHDPSVVKAYIDDPLVHDRVTPRLVRFIIDAGQRVRRDASNWAVPTLLLWAGADRCVDPAGSAEFAAAAPPQIVRHRRHAQLAHEIFNEPERDEVLLDLTRWLDTLHAQLRLATPA